MENSMKDEHDIVLEEAKSILEKKFIQTIDKKEKIDLKNNIFAILKIQDVEIRHSNFLAWLMDKEINGKVGINFLYNFLNELYQNLDLSSQLVNSEYKVFREYREGLNGRIIDILIYFEKCKRIVVIENKVYSTESENQLRDYYNYIEQKFQDLDGYLKTYVYLTIDGEKPENDYDKMHWKVFSYGQVLNILKKNKI